MKPVTITLELSDAGARALAKFVREADCYTLRELAKHDDETRHMLEAVEKLRQALAQEGYGPR